MSLVVNNLRTYFPVPGGQIAKAVDGVSFHIDEGETVCIVGESGCGKSVTAFSLMQLLPRAAYHPSGEILFKGEDVLKMSVHQKRAMRGRQMGMIFQEPGTALNPVKRVGPQVAEAIRIHEKLSASEASKRTIQLFEEVGIPHPELRFNAWPHELSGGMKQRVMIAMALACRPELLVADEPTTALDVTVQAQILKLLKKIQKERNMGVLMITHNLRVVNQVADRVVVMYAGRVVETADRKTLFENPKHPYTKALLKAIPGSEQRGQTLAEIPGRVPPATSFPEHCRFADRCDERKYLCMRANPELIDLGNDHKAACILHTSEEKALAMVPNVLEVKNLQTWFPIRKGLFQRTVGHVKAVNGVSFNIEKGKTLALVGESGCGKTTVGKTLLSLIPHTSGEVMYDNQDLFSLSPEGLQNYRKRMQIIFQDPANSMNPRMLVKDIIAEGIRSFNLLPESEIDAKVIEMLEKVGLSGEVRFRYPHEFSGGQRQRICIARALAVNPEFIVCDEATSALDVSVQASILNLLKELQEEMNLTYLFITHDLSVVEYLADRVAVMYLGEIVEEADSASLFSNPKHPYTKALLESAPSLNPDEQKLVALGGEIPSPINPPSGCRFHGRCPEVMDKCKQEEVAMRALENGRQCRCLLYNAE